MTAPSLAALAAAALTAAGAPPSDGAPALVTEARPVMGGLASVTLVADAPVAAQVGLEAAFAIFDRVDWAMNEWRADSPLAAVNRAAGSWVPIPGDLCRVLELGVAAAEETGGRFDPTWAAVGDLWRFDSAEAAPPRPDVVAERCALVGARGLALRRSGGACEARLARPGMRLGLGGLAKGWALDRAAEALRALGFRSFLLQAGGDLYAAGGRGARPWTVAIRDPGGGPLDAFAALDVSDRAFSTSGDYEHAFEAGGRRYHHVIDPRTCRPAEDVRAVTVLARTAVEGEILGKAVFVAGPEAGLALAARRGAEVVIVAADGAVQASPGLAGRLRAAPAVRERPDRRD